MARGQTVAVRKRITPRQRQILELVAVGLSDKQIAAKLRVSPRTVQSHLERFFVVHGVHKRAAAVAYLLAHQVTRTPPWDLRREREG